MWEVIAAAAVQAAKAEATRRFFKILAAILPVVAILWGAVFIGVGLLFASLTQQQQSQQAVADPAPCVTTIPASSVTTTLSKDQVANAATIVAVGKQLKVPPAGLVVAVMTAMQESTLVNLNHGNLDSLGLFQQRPSQGWGTPAQVMNPAFAARTFFTRLMGVTGWQLMPLTVAAQTVQRSGFPGAYAKWEPQARSLVGSPGVSSAVCAGGSGQVPAGPPGANGLPAAYKIPPGTSAQAAAAVTSALGELGKPYVYGATGPTAFDCSGLTQSAWKAGGKSLRRVTTGQLMDGTATTQAALLPGDLVLTPGSDGTLAAPGHMGLFIGAGLVVDAPHTGAVVHVVTLSSFISGGVSGLRHIA